MLKNLLLQTISGFDEMTQKAIDILSDAALVNDYWNQLMVISNVLKPFAAIIIVFCVLYEIGDVTLKMDMLKWEHTLKLALKVCIAKVFIDIAPVFLQAVYLQTAKWIVALGKISGTSLGAEAEGIITPLLEQKTDIWTTIGLFMTCLIVTLAIKLCGVFIEVMAFGRIMELCVYAVSSPIPCAFFPLSEGGGGMSRITSRFLREFAAVCLQGVVMLIVMKIFDVLISDTLASAMQVKEGTEATAAIGNVLYTLLIGSVALVMGVFSSGKWAKSMLDVG